MSNRLGSGRWSYVEYFDSAAVSKGLKNQTLFRGVLRVNAQKKFVAYVTTDGAYVDISIDNEILRNRAIHGDVVIVQLLNESEWVTELSESQKKRLLMDVAGEQTESFIDDPQRDDDIQTQLWRPLKNIMAPSQSETNKTLAASNDHPINEACRRTGLQPRGSVVFVEPRTTNITLIGSLDAQCPLQPKCKLPKSAPYIFFKASDSRYPNLIISRNEVPEGYAADPYNMQKQIYLAELTPSWPIGSKLPFGCNVRSIGEFGAIQPETEALLLENHIDASPFRAEVLEPLQKLLGIKTNLNISLSENMWTIPDEEYAKRRDLRNTRIFTIDPPNAKDLDDALHITQLSEDLFEIGVHIADVSYFIEEHSLLDQEAQSRATSVYLVQKVIPMLPSILCEQLCSLNPNVDRLAFSCIWRMHSNGTLADDEPWFGKTIIRSCAKLDYPTAQRMIDGKFPIECPSNSHLDYFRNISEMDWETARRPPASELYHPWAIVKDVCLLNSIAKPRRECRLANGALLLLQPKLTFQLDANGNPIECKTYEIKESNQLVEEYMLLANYLVAQQLVMTLGSAAFLRRHPPPSMQGLDELKSLASHLGYEVDIDSAQSLQNSLNEIIRSSTSNIVEAMTCLVMKPMQVAQYFVVDTFGSKTDAWKHYALSIPYYTHFTSPIRRYADVIVHRLLEISLDFTAEKKQSLLKKESLDRLVHIAAHCNERKEAAKKAQQRSDEVYLAVYLKSAPVETTGVVIGIGPKSFTVYVPSFGVQTRMFVDEMLGVSFSYDENTKKLVLSRGGEGGGGRSGNRSSIRLRQGSGSDMHQSMRFQMLIIELMGTVAVQVAARSFPPTGIHVSLVGLGRERSGSVDGNTPSPVTTPTLPENDESKQDDEKEAASEDKGAKEVGLAILDKEKIEQVKAEVRAERDRLYNIYAEDERQRLALLEKERMEREEKERLRQELEAKLREEERLRLEEERLAVEREKNRVEEERRRREEAEKEKQRLLEEERLRAAEEERLRLEEEERLRHEEEERVRLEEERIRLEEEEKFRLEEERIRLENEERIRLEEEERARIRALLNEEEKRRFDEQERLRKEEELKRLEQERLKRAEEERIRREEERLRREEERKLKMQQLMQKRRTSRGNVPVPCNASQSRRLQNIDRSGDDIMKRLRAAAAKPPVPSAKIPPPKKPAASTTANGSSRKSLPANMSKKEAPVADMHGKKSAVANGTVVHNMKSEVSAKGVAHSAPSTAPKTDASARTTNSNNTTTTRNSIGGMRRSSTAPAPASKVSGPAPASKVTDPAPASKVTDPAPASKVTDPAPASKVSGPAPVSKVTDPAPASKVTDPAPASKAAATHEGNVTAASMALLLGGATSKIPTKKVTATELKSKDAGSKLKHSATKPNVSQHQLTNAKDSAAVTAAAPSSKVPKLALPAQVNNVVKSQTASSSNSPVFNAHSTSSTSDPVPKHENQMKNSVPVLSTENHSKHPSVTAKKESDPKNAKVTKQTLKETKPNDATLKAVTASPVIKPPSSPNVPSVRPPAASTKPHVNTRNSLSSSGLMTKNGSVAQVSKPVDASKIVAALKKPTRRKSSGSQPRSRGTSEAGGDAAKSKGSTTINKKNIAKHVAISKDKDVSSPKTPVKKDNNHQILNKRKVSNSPNPKQVSSPSVSSPNKFDVRSPESPLVPIASIMNTSPNKASPVKKVVDGHSEPNAFPITDGLESSLAHMSLK